MNQENKKRLTPVVESIISEYNKESKAILEEMKKLLGQDGIDEANNHEHVLGKS